MSVVGIGIDVVPVARFEAAMRRRPALLDRLFNAAEQHAPGGALRPADSLAARFAAKEALAKALGAGGGMLWTDAEVVADEDGNPALEVRGSVAARAEQLGVRSIHVSLSHDGGIAAATVIVES